jgi:hypothetical protein
MRINKLFVSTFGPEKSGMLCKKKEVQLIFLNDSDMMGIAFTKLQVDAYLDQLERDLKVVEQTLSQLYPDQPMDQPEAVPTASEQLIMTTAKESTAEDGSGSMELLTVVAEDSQPIKLKKEHSLEKPDIGRESDDEEGSAKE